ASELLNLRELHALRLIGNGFLVWPAGRDDPPPQVIQDGLRQADLERVDRAISRRVFCRRQADSRQSHSKQSHQEYGARERSDAHARSLSGSVRLLALRESAPSSRAST